MPKSTLAVALCAAGLLAGCGSSSHTRTLPDSGGSTTGSTTGRGALNHTGRVGALPKPVAGGTLDATHPTVLRQIESQLVSYYSAKGFSGVTAICSGKSATSASCKVTGTNTASKASTAVITLSLDPTTGVLKVLHVT